MQDVVTRTGTGGRLALSADAFIYAGALFLLSQALLGLVVLLIGTGYTDIPGSLFMLASPVGGAVLAWLAHGRKLRGTVWLGMLAGIVAGVPLAVAAFFALFFLARVIPNPMPSVEGPWGFALLLLVAVVAFLVMPIVEAVRDLGAGRRAHVRLDWIRLAVFAVVAATVVGTVVYGVMTGSEIAEIGAFMAPVAAIGACAALGADLLEAWRAGRAHPATPAAPA